MPCPRQTPNIVVNSRDGATQRHQADRIDSNGEGELLLHRDGKLVAIHSPGWRSASFGQEASDSCTCKAPTEESDEPEVIKVGYTWSAMQSNATDALAARSSTKAFTEQVTKLRKAIDDHAGQDINITVEITDLKSLGNAIEWYRAMNADNKDKDRLGGYILRKADQLGALTEDGMIVLGNHVITSTGDDDEGDCCPAGAK